MSAKKKESSQVIITSALLKYFDDIKNDTPCWYSVNSNPSSNHSLCGLLGLEKGWYNTFLFIMQFKREKKGKTVNDWGSMEAFALNHLGSKQWDRYRLGTESSPSIWFRVGGGGTSGYSVKDQFKNNTNPPTPSINQKARDKFLKVWYANKPKRILVEKDDNKESKKKKAKSKKTDSLPFVVTPSSKTQMNIEKNLDRDNILNILGRELLSKLFDEESMKDIVDTYRSSLTIDEVLECVASTHIRVRQERDNIMQKKKRALVHATKPQKLNVDPSSFPYLLSKEIDVMNSDDISRLLREVSRLQKEVVSKEDGIDIFQFLQGNDKTTTLVRVPTNKTRKHFQHNLTSNNKGYNFVFRMLDAMIPPSNNDIAVVEGGEEDEDGDHDRATVLWTRRIHAAEGMIVYLAKKFGAAFIRAADVVGMPVVKNIKRMDVATSAAMCDDAGLSNFQTRIINKYATHTFGHPLTAPEREMKQLGEKVIPPICGVIEVNKERCPFFKKDPVEVIEKKVQEAVEHDASLEWDRLDIILGGDHGQGAFRVPIKLLLKNDRQEIKVELEYNIGEVECKKDTSDVLRATLFPYLNERLKTIINYQRHPITNEITGTRDGTIYEYRRFQNDVAVTRFSFQHNAAEEGEELVRERPITFIVTGDLAFYAVILGMKNAAPFHCHLCRLRKLDWEKHPNEKGAIRSMTWLLNNWDKAKQGKGGRICGVVERPLLDTIDPSCFVVPPLHSMLGVANSILNDFKKFIDILLEDAPNRLKILRNSELIAEKRLNDQSQRIADWGMLNGSDLVRCHETKDFLLTLQDSIILAGDGTNEEKEEIKLELQEVENELEALRAERESLVQEEAALSTSWKRKRAKLSSFLKSKEGKKHIKPVKARFETALRKFGVDYAAYHGGDLVGNDCRILMGRAEEIFQMVEEVLLTVAAEKKKKEETKEAIKSRCGAIRDALVVFDSVFAIVNKPNSKVEMEKDLPEMKMLLQKGLLAWSNLKDKNERGDKNITPKIHGLLQHLPDQFQLYGGLGDYDEQFVERNHQVGKKDKLRGRNLRDVNTRFTSFSFWEARRKNRAVIAKSVIVKESRKRNFKGERKETAKDEASRMRASIRERIIAGIEPRDLSGESARILAQMELDEYNPIEEEINYDRVDSGEVEGDRGLEEMDDDDSIDGSIVGGENI